VVKESCWRGWARSFPEEDFWPAAKGHFTRPVYRPLRPPECEHGRLRRSEPLGLF
jgi:hypothetical protein